MLRGTETIGRIHGVNQKGMYGGMQLILATDPGGTIVGFYYQKLSSPEAARFRDESFTSQFVGLTLEDLLALRARGATAGATVVGGTAGTDRSLDGRGASAVARDATGPPPVSDPSENSEDDFDATVRGITKNMLLLHEFFAIDAGYADTNEGGAR